MDERHKVGDPKSVTQLLDELDRHLQSGESTGFEPIPTGFAAFDTALGGGLRRGDLVVMAGPPGIGKTILGLQLARQLAVGGHPAILVCYEHDQVTLLLRLLAQETGAGDHRERILRALKDRLVHGSQDRLSLDQIMLREPVLGQAFETLRAIGDDLVLVSGSTRSTGLDEMHKMIAAAMEYNDWAPVLIVDYLQKVAGGDSADDRSRGIVEGLKDIAMTYDLPVVTMASLTTSGLEARNLRLSHLDETSTIAFEADVVVLMNEKVDALAKAHLAYGGAAVNEYPNWVVWSIAKNRSGPNNVSIEFRKDFPHFRFHPEGRQVSERLADDRMVGDAT